MAARPTALVLLAFSGTALPLCGQTPARAPFHPMHFRGIALAHVHARTKGYGSGISRPLLVGLRKRGFNLIQLNPFGYQPSRSVRTISFADPTLRDDDLALEIRAIHGQGMQVMLAPHIWLGQDGAPAVWRSGLQYPDARELDEWFAAYRLFVLHYARIARVEHVAVLAVAVELEQLARHTERFRALIREIRAEGYRGLLTYECEAWNATNIGFWDDLDFIGLNFYYSHSREVRQRDRREFSELSEFLASRLRQHYAHGARIGKPVVLTEFGYPAHDRAISKTSAWPSRMTNRDDEAQRTGFMAMRRALALAGLPGGIIFWKYVTTLDSYEKANYPTDFIIQGKPAERVMDEIVRLR